MLMQITFMDYSIRFENRYLVHVACSAQVTPTDGITLLSSIVTPAGLRENKILHSQL